MKLTKNEWLRGAGRQMRENKAVVFLMAMGLLGLALTQVARAQAVSTTTVQGTVYLANGQAGSGTLQVSWPMFTTANGQAVAADSTTVTIAPDGFVSVNLTPNLGATPAGLYYTAVFYMSDGTTSTQYWVVPAAAQASLAQVQSQLMPAAQAVQAVSKTYVDESISELTQSLLTASGGTLSGPLYLNGDPSQALQAADKHYVDTAMSQAVPLSGGNMTGALGTPAVNGVQAPAANSSQTTLQAAITAAGTSGAMEIPPTYMGTDAFTNPNGVRVADLRTSSAQQTERSVKEFGAVCDGVTDDTNALQSALNYAEARGVALTIPQGTCKTRSLNWHGESIGGMGKQVSALMGFPGQDVLASVADSANLLEYARLHDLTIYVDQSMDVSCSAAEGRAAAGSCGVNRPLEINSIFSRGGNGLTGTAGTGAAWAVGNCAIAMPATTGAGGNGLRVAELENLEIAATGVDPLAAQYTGAHSTHTCGMYLAQWPKWTEFRNIDIRGLNTGIALPALPGTAPAGLNADSNRWQNITIQATHGFTAAAGSNNVLDNVVEMAGNSAATAEPPTGLVLDLVSTQQSTPEGWTVRNAVVMPSWNAVQPQLTVTAQGGAVTGVTVGLEHGLGFDPYGTQVPLQFSGSCSAQATAHVNSDGSIGTVTVSQGGVGCSGTTAASVSVAGTWDTAAPVNLIGGQSMTFFAGNLLKGNGGYTVWNAVGSEIYGTILNGGGGTLPSGGTYAALVANNAGTGGVVIGSSGTGAPTVAMIDNAGNAQFNGTVQVGGTSTFTGSTTVRNQADAEIDDFLWAGATASQKESLIYKDWNGNSQWYAEKDASNNWELTSATGGLDTFKAYQSTNGGDTYINATNASGVVRVNYETGSGTSFTIYGGSSSSLYAAFTGAASIRFPGLAAGSGHNCLQIDNSGYVTNTGSACGSSSGGSGTVSWANSGQIAYYTGNGTSVGGMSAVPLTSGGTGAVNAAAALQNLSGISSTVTSQQTIAGPLNVPTAYATSTGAYQLSATRGLAGYVTPELYGAYGDGTHDDTVAIQACWNASSTSSLECRMSPSGGGTACGTSSSYGCYLVNGQLTVQPYMHVEGNSLVSTLIKSEYNGPAVVMANGPVNGVVMKNLNFVLDKALANSAGFYFQAVASSGNGGLWYSEFQNISVDNPAKECLRLDGGGTQPGYAYNLPNQFLQFDAFNCNGPPGQSHPANLVEFSGQAGQIVFRDGSVNGDATSTGTGTGITYTYYPNPLVLIQPVGGTTTNIAPGNITFSNFAVQSGQIGYNLVYSQNINILDGSHAENLGTFLEGGSSTFTVDNGFFGNVGTSTGGLFSVGGSMRGAVSNSTITADGSHPIAALASCGSDAQMLFQNNAMQNQNLSTSGCVTGNVSVSSATLTYFANTTLVNGDNCSTPVTTLSGPTDPGQTVTLIAWTNKFCIASGGSISLGQYVSPLSVPVGSLVTLRRLDLGQTYAIEAVSAAMPMLPSSVAGYNGNSSGIKIPLALTWDTPNQLTSVCHDANGNLTDGGCPGYTPPTQYKTWSCQPGLGDGTSAITTATYYQTTCRNDSGSTYTITGLACFTDNSGSSTLSATDGSSNALLTGAITCSSSWAAGTQSSTATIAAGGYVKFTFFADGTSKQATFDIHGTY